MGWESVYDPRAKTPGKDNENCIQKKVFDRLKKVDDMKAQWEKTPQFSGFKDPTAAKMERAVLCIVKILGATSDMKYSVFKDKEALKGLVSSLSAVLPSTSPASAVDFFTMGVDKALGYLDLYKEAKQLAGAYPKYSKGQQAAICYLNRAELKGMTVSKWAEQLMDIADAAMEHLRYAGGDEAPKGWAGAFKQSDASKVSRENLFGLVLYVDEVRPLLYFLRKHGGKIDVSTVQ